MHTAIPQPLKPKSLSYKRLKALLLDKKAGRDTTEYLTQSPANRDRLFRAIADIESQKDILLKNSLAEQ
ncbi:hypothetical protein [Dyadobacter sandarakinus]|uniref:Uncharacterized protein n=1 Tax=Dyadobacter sandarakinus TaxID=2747268 RepID=A0ABX7IDG6_9BACT|nr:hypothetical protein [Dyadobacter sandarakinus]QRR03848.1 hypothetical protein HWI92_24515 [Dyadobacter sandarakinus]